MVDEGGLGTGRECGLNHPLCDKISMRLSPEEAHVSLGVSECAGDSMMGALLLLYKLLNTEFTSPDSRNATQTQRN